MSSYPLTSGNKHDWSSVEIDVDGKIYTGVTELTYSDELKPGDVGGTNAQRLARTRGKYTAEGSMSMHTEDGHELMLALSAGGVGFKEKIFGVTCMYSDPGTAVITDKLIACRITSTEGGGSDGGDPTAIKFGLDVMRVEWNGLSALTSMLK